jgi:hypothetical protein
MARVADNSILAGVSGSFGNVVVYMRMGKTYIRSKPINGTKKKRVRTIPQQAQTGKMKVLSSFQNITSDFLKIGFKQKGTERNMTADNAAKSVNLLHGVKGEFPEQEINWDTVLVSDGDLIKPENVKVTVAENTFHFSWDEAQSITTGSPDDRTMILLYDKVEKRFQACYSGARRSELKDVFMLRPTRIKNKTFEVFIAFKDILSDAVSKSVYCGSYTCQD